MILVNKIYNPAHQCDQVHGSYQSHQYLVDLLPLVSEYPGSLHLQYQIHHNIKLKNMET